MKKAFVLIAGMITFLFSCGSSVVKDLSPEAFQQAITADTVILLDVRTADEFLAGHIEGAGTININGPVFHKKINELDREKAVYVYCAVGGRSSRAAKELENIGFQKVFNLSGGIEAWQEAGFPVEK